MTSGPAGVILLYHRVQDVRHDPFHLSVPPALFERHLSVVRESFEPTTVRELLRYRTDGAYSRRRVAITFDDGYLDNLQVASPRLLAAGVPATFFVTTQSLGGPGRYWWDALAARDDNPDRCREACREMIDAAPDARNVRVLQLLADRLAPACSDRPMIAAEIAELASRPGHDIGAHTVTHAPLTREHPASAFRELYESRVELEYLLNRPIDLIAYPFGQWDERLCTLAHQSGYRAGFSVGSSALSADTNLFAIPRIQITAEMTEIELVIHTALAD